MLSRTAGLLYWIGRYVERADFTARLIEATIRLDALPARGAEGEAWVSALAVAASTASFEKSGEPETPAAIGRFLALSAANPSSIRSCLDSARSNARAVRTALTREAWESINRSWLDLRKRSSAAGIQGLLALSDSVKAESRGFEGALHRMLRNEAYWFVRLGAAIERADNTARLLDVKYHLLLPKGARVGGPLDRDQWTTILQVVSAVTAYRWIYPEGLKPWLIADLLIWRREMPRSLAACVSEVVEMLTEIGGVTGRQGEADRQARIRQAELLRVSGQELFQAGLHEFLADFITENAAMDQAIASQFRFG
jgi:uncharacterized alpha-E superfamily protein